MILSRYSAKINQINSLPKPTAQEVEESSQLVAKIKKEHGDLPVAQSGFFDARSSIILASLAWLELIWFPSLLTGLLFRGGLILRLFGLDLVNRRGQPASGLRVFIRMFATATVPVSLIILQRTLAPFIAGGFIFPRIEGTIPGLTKWHFMAAIIAIILILAVIAYRSRRRFFSDRLASTYLVVR